MSDASAPQVEYHKTSYGQDADFLIPVQWSFDGDYRRRAPVMDVVSNRVVRRVGWKRCLICKTPFFSHNVKSNFICDANHASSEME